MKSLLLLISMMVLPAAITSAHLGETWGQCEARYGKPVFSNKEFATYEKDGIRIEITFDGLSDHVSAATEDARG